MSDLKANEMCELHLKHAEEICKGCNLQINKYGNTEAQFEYCSFPNCGCDGARLCMAGKPNFASMSWNFEQGSQK